MVHAVRDQVLQLGCLAVQRRVSERQEPRTLPFVAAISPMFGRAVSRRAFLHTFALEAIRWLLITDEGGRFAFLPRPFASFDFFSPLSHDPSCCSFAFFSY